MFSVSFVCVHSQWRFAHNELEQLVGRINIRLQLFSLLNFTSSFKKGADGLGDGGVLLILGFIDFLSFFFVSGKAKGWEAQ